MKIFKKFFSVILLSTAFLGLKTNSLNGMEDFCKIPEYESLKEIIAQAQKLLAAWQCVLKQLPYYLHPENHKFTKLLIQKLQAVIASKDFNTIHEALDDNSGFMAIDNNNNMAAILKCLEGLAIKIL